ARPARRRAVDGRAPAPVAPPRGPLQRARSPHRRRNARGVPARRAALRTVVQRVLRAAVRVDGETVGAIDHGALLLVGVERTDTPADAAATAAKIAKLRFFP